MASPMFYDALKAISADDMVRAVFEEAMKQTGKTGWNVSRVVTSTKHASPTTIEKALRTLQEKQVLQGTGGVGLSAYYFATPMAFELKETLR